MTGPVAQWIRHLTTNQGIPGSSPGGVVFDLWIGKHKASIKMVVKTDACNRYSEICHAILPSKGNDKCKATISNNDVLQPSRCATLNADRVFTNHDRTACREQWQIWAAFHPYLCGFRCLLALSFEISLIFVEPCNLTRKALPSLHSQIQKYSKNSIVRCWKIPLTAVMSTFTKTFPFSRQIGHK